MNIVTPQCNHILKPDQRMGRHEGDRRYLRRRLRAGPVGPVNARKHHSLSKITPGFPSLLLPGPNKHDGGAQPVHNRLIVGLVMV